MKNFLFLLALVFSVNAFAVTPALVCREGGEVVRATARNASDMPLLGDCADALYNGEVCFVGSRKGVIAILETLGDNDVFGDEMRMRGVGYSGRENVRFYVWDGPNEWLSTSVTLKPCR